MRGVVMTAVLVTGLVGCSSDDPTDATAITLTNATTVTTLTTDAATATTVVDTTAPADHTPTTVPTPGGPASSTVPTGAVTPSGFDLVQAIVTTADGEVCELCLWVASTAGQRRQGLMGVTDLGDGDGMAFVYDAPRTGSFWMKNTVLPLSIAFFDADGAYLDAFDMEPCTADTCPRYATAPDFIVAIEAEQGGLADLGIAEGSRLVLTDLPCE